MVKVSKSTNHIVSPVPQDGADVIDGVEDGTVTSTQRIAGLLLHHLNEKGPRSAANVGPPLLFITITGTIIISTITANICVITIVTIYS